MLIKSTDGKNTYCFNRDEVQRFYFDDSCDRYVFYYKNSDHRDFVEKELGDKICELVDAVY